MFPTQTGDTMPAFTLYDMFITLTQAAFEGGATHIKVSNYASPNALGTITKPEWGRWGASARYMVLDCYNAKTPIGKITIDTIPPSPAAFMVACTNNEFCLAALDKFDKLYDLKTRQR